MVVMLSVRIRTFWHFMACRLVCIPPGKYISWYSWKSQISSPSVVVKWPLCEQLVAFASVMELLANGSSPSMDGTMYADFGGWVSHVKKCVELRSNSAHM